MSQLNSIITAAIRELSKLSPHVVGGSVRDRLLKRPITDVDIVTSKDPHPFALKLAKQLKGTTFRLDEEFGISRISLRGGLQLDLARCQGATLQEDLGRRDFTVNAMAVPLEKWNTSSWKKNIVDPHEGERDLRHKTLRLVSKRIFSEDPIRLLRAFRISAELGIKITADTFALIKKNKALIKKTSAERVRDEILKLFSVDLAYPTVLHMETSGLLEQLLPECRKLRSVGHDYYGKGGVLTHTLDSLMFLEDIFETLGSWFPKCHKKIALYLEEKMSGYPRAAHLKWGVLLHDLGKPDTAKFMEGRLRFFEHEHVGAAKIPKMAGRFRWSSNETALYARLVKNHMRPGNLATAEIVSDKAIHRFFRDLGDDAIAMLLVSLGDHLSYLSAKGRKARKSPHELLTKKMVNKYYLERAKVLPARILNGHDIMKAFKLKPSPVIGDMLKDLNEAQSDGHITTKEQALEYLRKNFV